MAIDWGQVAALLLGINGLMFGEIFRRLFNIEKKLDEKVKEQSCILRHDQLSKDICKKIDDLKQENGQIWEAFNKHSHAGIEKNGRVIRQ